MRTGKLQAPGIGSRYVDVGPDPLSVVPGEQSRGGGTVLGAAVEHELAALGRHRAGRYDDGHQGTSAPLLRAPGLAPIYKVFPGQGRELPQLMAATRSKRRRLARMGTIGLLVAAMLAALVRAFDFLGFGTPETGDRITVEGTVAEEGLAGLVLGTGDGRLLLSGIERVDPTVEPGNELRVEGKFFEVSIHHLSGVQVERVERL